MIRLRLGQFAFHRSRRIERRMTVSGRSIVMKRILANSLLGCLGLVFALLILEVIVRFGGATDADGQFSFLGYTLEPYVLPINRLREGVDAYLQNVDSATILYDEETGWAYRPNSLRHQGTFTVNSSGMRSQREYMPRTATRYPAYCRLWGFIYGGGRCQR